MKTIIEIMMEKYTVNNYKNSKEKKSLIYAINKIDIVYEKEDKYFDCEINDFTKKVCNRFKIPQGNNFYRLTELSKQIDGKVHKYWITLLNGMINRTK